MPGLARALPGIPREPEARAEQDALSPLALAGAINPVAPLATAAANPQTWRDQATGYRYGRYRDTLVSERLALETAYDDLDDELHRITGRRIGNPIRERFYDPLEGNVFGPSGAATIDPIALWHSQFAQLAASDPRLAALAGRASEQAARARADQIRREVTQAYHDYLGDADVGTQVVRGLLLAPGMIAGALSTGSPEQIAQLGAGGGGRLAGIGAGVVERAAVRGSVDALANMAGQGLIEPAIAEDARRMGEERTLTDTTLDLVLAAVIGGALGAGGELAAPGAPPAPETPIRRSRSRLPEIVTLPPADADVTPARGAAVQEALAGRAESLVVAAAERDAATRAAMPDPEAMSLEQLADDIVANDRFIRGEADAPSPVERVPVADPDSIAAAAHAADDGPTLAIGAREGVTMNGRTRPRTFERFDAGALAFDPSAFQFKRASGPQGSTGRLQGVEAWDGQSAGKIIVFEAADGRLYVADGHQRVALAQALSARDEAPIALDGYRYREADGWTAREVRHLAAQKNLRETVGDPLDAAMLIREAPELLDSSVPQTGADFRAARALARLSQEAFDAVRAGQIEPRLGAVIGDVAGDRPELHAPLVDLFRKSPPANGRDAAFIAREAMQAAVVRMEAAQMTMFGDDVLIAGMQERAEVLRLAGNMLRDDKRVFAVAERHADALEAAGNVLAADENARRADLSAALLREIDALATRPGPVADALREIAARAAANKTPAKEAAREFVDAVTRLLDERGLLGLKTDPPLREPPPAVVEPPDFEAEARSAVLRAAHDRDAEALQQTMAEVALERAMRGDIGEIIPEDAIGHTPEADLGRIEEAADALGIEADFTEMQVAAALLAKPDAALEAEARARIEGAPEGESETPRLTSFAEAVEQDADIEAPWAVDDFEDGDALSEAIAAATLPELEAVAREMGLDGEARTRAEYAALFVQDGRYARGDGARSTTAQLVAAIRAAFPRYGAKLLERGRLILVQSVSDLPDQALRGFYAFDGARTPEQRKPMADALVHMRGSEGPGMGFSDYYAWQGPSGPMAAEILSARDGAPANVSFGQLRANGIGFAEAGGTAREAIETFSHAMAVIDRDAAERARPIYYFSGLHEGLQRVYARLATAAEPPAGYAAHVVNDGKMVMLIRHEVLHRAGSPEQAFYDAMPVSGATSPEIAAKQRRMAELQPDVIAEVMQKVAAKRGAFARGNNILGYSEGGRSWIVADNVAPDTVRGLVLHEAGVHVGMREMLGEEGFALVLREAERLYHAGDPDLSAGYVSAVRARTPQAQVWEEALAYAIMDSSPENMSQGLRGLLKRIYNSLRAWMWRTFPGLRLADTLTFEDMRWLALGGLRHAARNDVRALDANGRFAKEPDAGGRAAESMPDGGSAVEPPATGTRDAATPGVAMQREADHIERIRNDLDDCK